MALGCLNDILHGTLSVATSLNRHALSKLQTFFASCSPLHNIAAKWGLFTALQLTDVSMELTFPNAMACLRFLWPHARCPLLEVPGWLAAVVADLRSLLSTQHTHMDASPSSCVNLLCAIETSLQRYMTQQATGSKAAIASVEPSIALTMQTIEKFRDAWQMWESSVCGLQQLMLSNRDVACRVELDHFVCPPRV
ncbi:hypothetical protein DYB37_000546 [Aphanomyces astaci]|uniref:Uncharacterized protein n=1 Tax=Aphanomyces astaci TaxID=112090 RepID=A0A3R7AZL9_APHAT|nr:hypothetical protein DYB35_000169 [Aphanomyces astaci]RHZ27493.1 hypothetical protein DYB37_000546 [Aphanomyces astaci]